MGEQLSCGGLATCGLLIWASPIFSLRQQLGTVRKAESRLSQGAKIVGAHSF